MDERRSDRVAETIREELEEILNYELDDSRIGSVDVLEVVLRPDGRKAVARVALADPSAGGMEALQGARSVVRRLLAERLDLFRSPDLEFESSVDPETIPKMKSLLRRAKKGRARE